ncbi:MAG: hypothetical protein Q4B86_07100 [Eubacteriales bacterium]|nr:hypothetical protein [Eubacteriales bacterium]
MKDTIILNDNSTIEIDAMQSIGNMTINCSNVAEIQALKNRLTMDNLKTVKVKNTSDLVVGSYTDLIPNDIWTLKWMESGFELAFGLREKTELEKLRDEIRITQAIQDGAIADLGTAVSDMSATL